MGCLVAAPAWADKNMMSSLCLLSTLCQGGDQNRLPLGSGKGEEAQAAGEGHGDATEERLEDGLAGKIIEERNVLLLDVAAHPLSFLKIALADGDLVQGHALALGLAKAFGEVGVR